MTFVVFLDFDGSLVSDTFLILEDQVNLQAPNDPIKLSQPKPHVWPQLTCDLNIYALHPPCPCIILRYLNLSKWVNKA